MLFAMLMLIIGSSVGVMWSLGIIPLSLFGMRGYKITGYKLQKFLKNVKVASIWSNGEPDMWIIGKWYIGYLHTGKNDKPTNSQLYLLMPRRQYERQIDEIRPEKDKSKIYIGEKDSSFWYSSYDIREITAPTFDPTPKQLEIIDKIKSHYKSNNNSIVLLTGDTNTGKSMLGLLLCKYMMKDYPETHLIDTFNPSCPGDAFSKLYIRISPSASKPLVIVLDEIDVLIQRMHDGVIENHKNLEVQIRTKADWNQFLDRFDRKMYPYCIIIMTSNWKLSDFDNLDKAYFRENRINFHFELVDEIKKVRNSVDRPKRFPKYGLVHLHD